MTISLTDVGSGYKRSAINSNFTTIENEINNNLLSKNGGVGLEADLDANSQKVINLADGVNNKDAVNLQQLNGAIAAAGSGLIASQIETQKGSSASGQVFTFTGITYTVGGNNLLVFQNGVKLAKGRDYTETSSSSITIDSAITINSGDDFDFITNVATTNSTTDTSAITHTESGTDYNLATYLQNQHTTLSNLVSMTTPPPVTIVTDRGNGIFDRVLTSTVTPNGYNIVQSTGDATYSFVLRESPGEVYAEQYGVVGDGVRSPLSGTDDSAVLQYIFDNVETRSTVYLPNARIRIDTQLNLGVSRTLRIKLKGLGPKTELMAGASIAAIIQGPDNIANTNQLANSVFESIIFNGNSLANYGLNGYGNFDTFRDCKFMNCLVAGSDFSYGWDNTWINCYWEGNVDGFVNSQGQNNQNTFVACKWGEHTGFGMKINGSYGMGFINCAWELCEKGAIFGSALEALSFTGSCYFDNNGETGFSYTTPSVTINADIIFNGSISQTTMATANPVKGCHIQAPFVSQQGAGAHTFIYGISTESLTIDAPTLLTGETSDLFTTYGSTTESSQYSRNEGLRIISPNNFTNNIVVENSTTGFDGKPDMIMDKASSFNILPDMSAWTAIVGGAASTFVSSSEVHPLGPLIDVYELDAGASTSTSESYGVTLTATNYANLIGKPMLARVDVKNETSGATTTVAVNGWDDTHTGTTWRTFYVIFNMPASGTFNFTVKKSGNADRTFVAIPRLVELGADVKQMIS